MSGPKICIYCQAPLDFYIHGNSNYCDTDCSYAMKLDRSKEQYKANKKLRESFKKSDQILGMFHNTYGSDEFIPAILLDQAAMHWLISKGEIKIDDLTVKILLKYGYCLFKNETIKIWKISNQ